jgi:hypothetical protein
MNDLQEVQKKSFGFEKSEHPGDIKKFIKMRGRFIELEKNTYEKTFLYLDIISWLESKIENRRISDIMREKQN